MTQYIGIDNGVSGTVSHIGPGSPFGSEVWPTPVKLEQNYQKTQKNINRLDHDRFRESISELVGRIQKSCPGEQVRVVLEKPFVNPMNYVATSTSIRCFEAQLVILEQLGLSHTYLDAKAWQKTMLPEGTKGRPAQKKASLDLGLRLFPQHAEFIRKHKDADGLLIAEYCRKNQP